MGAVWVGALGYRVCGFVHLPLAQTGQCEYHCCQCRESVATRVMTTGITGWCLLLNELDVKRSKQWSQGYSNNEVSSGKREIELCLCSLQGRV